MQRAEDRAPPVGEHPVDMHAEEDQFDETAQGSAEVWAANQEARARLDRIRQGKWGDYLEEVLPDESKYKDT